MLTEINPEDKFGNNYKNHELFSKLELIVKFYDSLSFSVFGIVRFGTNQLFNLDSYFFSSIKGTIDSIRLLLKVGRINDAYSLIRKYYDSTIINIYTGLYLEDNYSIENLIVEKIEKWRNGTESIPDYRSISNYINNSPRLVEINKILKIDDRYKKIRDRCNDNTHYNFYRNVLLNDNEIHNPNRIKYLDLIKKDIQNLFIQHIAYLFWTNDFYMRSSDYVDHLEVGSTPPVDSEYWVANFVQEIFTEIVIPVRPDIYELIKKNTQMQLI
nr:hypothetical protein [uncultured Draconibacterium sp.]